MKNAIIHEKRRNADSKMKKKIAFEVLIRKKVFFSEELCTCMFDGS